MAEQETPEVGLMPDPEDEDPTLGAEDISQYSTSVRSSIYNYRYENGRTYHAFRDGSYLIPNDEVEQDRLDLLHHIWKMVLGGSLYTAPLKDSSPQHILDVGTGTGIWCIEMADEFPSASIVGIDLSPIQPTWVPPNCRFYVDDAEDEWQFTQKFDLIHGRALAGSISDWPKFYQEAMKNMAPNGLIEMQEHSCSLSCDDDSLKRAPWAAEWIANINKASEIVGKRLDVASQQKGWMEEAGFINVKEVIHPVPIGTWPKDKRLKEIGKYQRVQMIEVAEPYSLAFFTRVLKFSLEETQVSIANVRREFCDKSLHLYVKWHFVHGQKPDQ